MPVVEPLECDAGLVGLALLDGGGRGVAVGDVARNRRQGAAPVAAQGKTLSIRGKRKKDFLFTNVLITFALPSSICLTFISWIGDDIHKGVPDQTGQICCHFDIVEVA